MVIPMVIILTILIVFCYICFSGKWFWIDPLFLKIKVHKFYKLRRVPFDNCFVMITNKGKNKIQVDGFYLSEREESFVGAGILLPGGMAGMSPYFCRLESRLTIKWRIIETGETGQAEAVIKLPDEFTKKNGRGIYFHIDPEKNSVQVTYEVYDKDTDDFREIK